MTTAPDTGPIPAERAATPGEATTSPSAGISLLVVDDEDPFRELLERKFRRKGYGVLAAPGGPAALARLEVLGATEIDVAVLDMSMPEMDGLELLRELRARNPSIEAIILTGNASIGNAVESVKGGAFHYLEKPIQFAELEAHVKRAWDKRRLAVENRDLRAELRRMRPSTEIIGASPQIERTRELIDRFAATDSSVLVEGDSGTGKELVARALHERSVRCDKPFIPINCGALNATLLENELFGHSRGSFTGADRDRPGLFEESHKGTLFIDEVCEMDLDVQKKFLRVLENGELRRLGEAKIRRVDVRIIAATNKVVKEEVARGRFRQDLFFRLDVLHLDLPPLHERAGDLSLLVDHFLQCNRGRFPQGVRVADEVMDAFLRYRWPGNVRELFNLLERGSILSTDGVIRLRDVPGLVLEDAPASATPAPAPPEPSLGGGEIDGAAGGGPSVALPGAPVGSPDAAPTRLSEVEADHVRRILEECGGNKTQAAKLLGISLRSLYRKLEKLP